jgi:hypothetical protein
MGNKQGSQENKNKVEEQNSTREYMDKKIKEKVRTATRIEVENRNTERLNQERNECVSENGDNKKVDDRGSQNSESVVVQNQECGGGKNSAIRNNSMDPVVAQASTTNIQKNLDENLDKMGETRRISTRNKKIPSMRSNEDFLW